MRLRILLPVVLVLSLLWGTLAAPAQVDRSAIEAILEQMEGIRGLDADSGVPVDYLSQDQLREKMIQDFEEENPKEEIRTASEIMVMLGFIDPGLDLYKLYIDLYTEQIAGFYDPEENRMFLISEEQRMGPMDRYILAHELTHYLQDSNFDLQRPPFYDPPEAEEVTDDDASFAATCLVEGDAMLASQLWLARYMDPSDILEMQRESGEFSTEVLDSVPEYVRDGLLFPYEEGQRFVKYLHDRGGFRRVDEAFSRPPKSTEQIYHPEKYLAGEDPVPLELADLSGDLGEGWELAYDNVLGEFDVFELFKSFLRESEAKKAAEGWGGNVYHYYRHADGEKLLVQLYAWDSEGDATEFVSAHSVYMKRRFGKDLQEGEPRGAWRTWTGGGYIHALKKEGVNVYVLQSTGEGPLEMALAGLGEGGEVLSEELVEGEEEPKSEVPDYGWLVIAGVAGLFFLGIVLIVVMFLLLRRTGRTGGTPPPGGFGPGHYPVSPYPLVTTPRGIPGAPGQAPPAHPSREAPKNLPRPPSPPGGLERGSGSPSQ
ncbi:MAG: hypothetical protein ACUVS1_12520 [Actinomycetota bacterium]